MFVYLSVHIQLSHALTLTDNEFTKGVSLGVGSIAVYGNAANKTSITRAKQIVILIS